MATSTDGIRWQRANDGAQVLDIGGPGSHDEVQAATPCILREGRGYRMWYAAWAPTPGHTICTATSKDGLRWQRENAGAPVEGLIAGAYGPMVYRLGGEYLIWYMTTSRVAPGMHAAASRDGRLWTRLGGEAAALPPGNEGAFDSALTGHGCFLRAGRRLLAWYTGYRRDPDGPAALRLAIGLAEAELPS